MFNYKLFSNFDELLYFKEFMKTLQSNSESFLVEILSQFIIINLEKT